jgi:hypothetical protein
MVEKKSPEAFQDDAGHSYQIKIKGYIEEHWSDWLGGLQISHDSDGNSLLTGAVPDQAALHGILIQIRDLGLTLISIVPEDSNSNTVCKKGESSQQGSKSEMG